MSISLATSIGTVTVREAFEGYEAGVDVQRGPFVNKVYLCPNWASAFPVVNALLGAGRTPGRHACPESPNLRCVSATLMPRGEYDIRDAGRPQFNLAIVKATYGIPTWDELATDSAANSFPNEVNPGQAYTYMEQSIDFDTEVIKLPGRAYAFTSDAKPVDAPVACTIAVATFTLVRRWQETLPYNNVVNYLNKLNTATFLGQPRGQIKFRKARTRRQFTSDGTVAQEVEYVFQWRQYDHNKQHRPDSSAFETIEDSSGNMPFAYADLTQLLR